jgi:hypothetical protein
MVFQLVALEKKTFIIIFHCKNNLFSSKKEETNLRLKNLGSNIKKIGYGLRTFHTSLRMKEIHLKHQIFICFMLQENINNSKSMSISSSIKLAIKDAIPYFFYSFKAMVIDACKASKNN